MIEDYVVKRNLFTSDVSIVNLIEYQGREFVLKERALIPVELEIQHKALLDQALLQDKTGLVQVHEFWVKDGKLFVLMEYLSGYITVLAHPGDKPAILVKLFDILARLYKQGFVYIDASVENFMVNAAGTVKLIDLGKLRVRDNTNTHGTPWLGECFLKIIKWFSDFDNWPSRDKERHDLNSILESVKFIRQRYHIDRNDHLIPTESNQCKLDYMRKVFFNDVSGKRVLEVGSNAGFYSISAALNGAKRVESIDVDAFSIILLNRIASYFKVPVQGYQEPFSDKLLRFGKFDVVIICGVYHYVFESLKSHDKVFKILSLLSDSIFWEAPLEVDDPTTELLSKSNPWFASNYTTANILSAAGRYFNCKYLGDYLMPSRKFYWFTAKENLDG